MNHTKDARRAALERGIGQLDTADILKILEFPADRLLLDGGNFRDGKYCPLAIALDAPAAVADPDDESVRDHIEASGRERYGDAFVFNQMKGLAGNFYRDHRAEDLNRTAVFILAGRSKADG